MAITLPKIIYEPVRPQYCSIKSESSNPTTPARPKRSMEIFEPIIPKRALAKQNKNIKLKNLVNEKVSSREENLFQLKNRRKKTET